jgi:hypothetical protein
MRFAGFTYGPLIGIFFFGILSKRSIRDGGIPIVSLLAIFITFLCWYYSSGAPGVNGNEIGLFGTYKFGFELIILNALITFILITLWSFIGTNQKTKELLDENTVA